MFVGLCATVWNAYLETYVLVIFVSISEKPKLYSRLNEFLLGDQHLLDQQHIHLTHISCFSVFVWSYLCSNMWDYYLFAEQQFLNVFWQKLLQQKRSKLTNGSVWI